MPAILTAPGSTFYAANNPRWLGDVQVFGPVHRSIAAFGDSTTSSSPKGTPPHQRWTDALVGYGATVANAGASGGSLTHTGVFDSIPGTARMAKLVLEPNLTDVIILIGENDIYTGVSESGLLNGYSTILGLAKAHHIQAWIMTILPRVGSIGWTSAMEGARQDINRFLRSSFTTSRGARLIDADALMRNPSNPGTIQPQYDSGDHAHPNAAGAKVLGTYAGRVIGLIK